MRTKLTALAVALVAGLAMASTANAQDRHHGGGRGNDGHATRDHSSRGGDWRGHDRGHRGGDWRGGWHYRGYASRPYYGRPWPYYSSAYWPSERARWLCEYRGICPDWYYRPGYYGPRFYEPGFSLGFNIR